MEGCGQQELREISHEHAIDPQAARRQRRYHGTGGSAQGWASARPDPPPGRRASRGFGGAGQREGHDDRAARVSGAGRGHCGSGCRAVDCCVTPIDPLWAQGAWPITGWHIAALEPPRAFGPALGSGLLRAQSEDFIVEEDLGFAPAGMGQHVLLKVRKRDANTQWVARELAKVCGCRPMDVGYAGLKDRRAVAVQWFTVPKSAQSLDGWTAVRTSEFEVLEAHAHTRKLPRGALAGNRFTIRVRDVTVGDDQLAERVG